MMHTNWAGAVVVAVLLGGCGANQPADPSAKESTPAAASTSPTSTRTPMSVTTARLDSMAVLGHSGATGTMSDPADPSADAHENSWATGDNPLVKSVYLRLLADHPALKGHNYNQAVNGTTVENLQIQFESLLAEADPLPDVILIQTIDNDMGCDGSDPDNYEPFGRTLDQTLTQIEKAIPKVQFFIVSQWASVATWTDWAAHHEGQVLANSGTGPCDVFNGAGKPRPAGIRSMQEIVDSYWAQVEKVCAAHPGCFTDQGAEQAEFVPKDRDVTADLNHLSIAGHKKMAAIAWQAFPKEIKQRQ